MPVRNKNTDNVLSGTSSSLYILYSHTPHCTYNTLTLPTRTLPTHTLSLSNHFTLHTLLSHYPPLKTIFNQERAPLHITMQMVRRPLYMCAYFRLNSITQCEYDYQKCCNVIADHRLIRYPTKLRICTCCINVPNRTFPIFT